MKTLLSSLLLSILLVTPAWGFPENSVLDTFTGTDNTSPPNSNWTNGIDTATGLDLEDNAVTSSSSGTFGTAYYNAITPGASQEAYVQIVQSSGQYKCVYARIVNVGVGSADGYVVCASPSGGDANTVQIYRKDNGSDSLLTPAISQTVSIGDWVGIKTVGDQICAWYRDADTGDLWTELGCRTDGNYINAGRIGMGTDADTTIGVMDNFGGGNVTVASSRRPIAPIILN